MDQGIGFDGSSLGLKNVKAGDMIMVPDLSSGFIDPFWDVLTLSFICTALDANTHQPFKNDPRNLARKAERYLQETGIASSSKWGPEFEFYVFDDVFYENRNHTAGYYFESLESASSFSTAIREHISPCTAGTMPVHQKIASLISARRLPIIWRSSVSLSNIIITR